MKNTLHHRRGLLHVSDRAQRSRGVPGKPFRNRRPSLPQRRRARRIHPHACDSRGRLLAPVFPGERHLAGESQGVRGLRRWRRHAPASLIRHGHASAHRASNWPSPTIPHCKPERTRSVDAGIEQKLLRNLLLLDATYFYNRYYDLIVTLGGSLTTLSHYKSANLANSRAQGAEFSRQPAAGALGLRHRFLHAARDANPFARWLEQSGSAAVRRRAAVDPPARALRQLGRHLHARTADGRSHRLFSRAYSLRGARARRERTGSSGTPASPTLESI